MSERLSGSVRVVVETPSRYRVHVLPDPKVTERGIVYRRGSGRLLLEWDRVRRVLAGLIGEPDGVSTVVFDLAVETRGSEVVVCRIDAERGDPALALARSIELGVGRERCARAVRDTSLDGAPQARFPDLETFQDANLEALRFG